MNPRVFAATAAVVALAGLLLGLRGAAGAPSPKITQEISASEVRRALLTHDRVSQATTLAPTLAVAEPADLDLIGSLFEEAFPSGGGSDLALRLYVEAMAEADPFAALGRIETWPRDRQQEAMPELIYTWARFDPKTAEQILSEVHDPDVRPRAFLKFINGWWTTGDPAIWSYLAGAAATMSQEQATNALLKREIATEGIEATLRKIEELPDPEFTRFRAMALKTTIGIIARSDPEQARVIVEAHRDDEMGDLYVRRLVVNWVSHDPEAAMDWILSMPASKHRDRVSREGFRRWIVHDRISAMAWMEGLDDYAGLGVLTDIQATALARDDIPRAIEWASRLEEPRQRTEALLDIAQYWHHREPEPARVWVREIGLEPAFDAQLEKAVSKPRARGKRAQVDEPASG